MTEGFPTLVAAVQVGARKSPPARATDFPLDGPERTVLLELGALGLMRRAGTRGIAATPLPPAPPETLKVALSAADPLEEALDGSLFAALEWAREAARKGFVAPTSVVSTLVPLAARHPEFRPVLGERGRWLAALMKVALVEATDLPSKDEWESLDPKTRARLVEGLPEDDAELFTKALGDRRKEVREAAAERLIRLPDSSHAGELRRMALAAVRVEKSLLRTKLVVEPPAPDLVPKWLPRSGSVFGMGPAALALFDVVSHVPPDAWEIAPERLLDLAAGTEYAEALTLGLQGAAVRFEDQDWIDACFRRALDSPRNLFTGALANVASEAVFDSETTTRLRAQGTALNGLLDTLALTERPLSPLASREAVRAAQSNKGGHYAFEALGKWLDPSVLPLLDEPWNERAEWLRQRWHKVLDLRARLRKSLE